MLRKQFECCANKAGVALTNGTLPRCGHEPAASRCVANQACLSNHPRSYLVVIVIKADILPAPAVVVVVQPVATVHIAIVEVVHPDPVAVVPAVVAVVPEGVYWSVVGLVWKGGVGGWCGRVAATAMC